ncbi:MAG: hypothetical protein WA117_24760 [Verrucomicrobiia bacterium]
MKEPEAVSSGLVMSAGLSEQAQRALERLTESWTSNWYVRTAILSRDPSPEGATVSVNWRLYQAIENYLGAQQVTHAADTLNSYCQSILAEILKIEPSVYAQMNGLNLGKGINSVSETIEVLELHRGYDGPVREALRDRIHCYWSPESDVIAKLRNKIIHQNGYDPDHEVEKEIASKNGQWCVIYPEDLRPGHIPIRYSQGDWLEMNAEIGYWACRHVENHIHLMDQNLCHRFQISRRRWRSRSVRWTTRSLQTRFPTAPGVPLPVKAPEVAPIEPPGLGPDPDYSMTTNPKEKHCAQVWLTLNKQAHDFVCAYCSEAGIQIVGFASNRAGSVLGHTIHGHDVSLEYTLVPKGEPPTAKSEHIGIRLRQRNFEPFVTVWGSNSMMCDIETSELSEPLKSVLRDCIDKALTRQ